ncbi:unnamed protein product [Phaedon cochleariae]|uniref:Uncharacterized protein n=1 Tax=Phaedon cochleariae TaxID=80249 RepID=A0A9N9SG18_PHACE|nr:unnamed protein product [Phaedon cochleariae]
MKRDENSNVLKDKNHVISAGNHETSSSDILHAVIRIQRLWRGYRTRRNLKNFNSRSKRHAGGNLDSDAMVSAVIIQKMWRGFKARKLMKMQKSSDAHAFPKQISSAIDKDHHDALIDKSFGTDTKEHTEMNTLLDEILDYPVIEEQHLIDTYQNKLLDKISGKDVNEDLEVYKALTSKRVEELESDVEKDLDTIHTSPSSKPQGVKPKLESLAEEPTDENESSKLYTFCSVPSPIPCDSKVVEGKPLSDLVETIDKMGEDTVEKALQHSTSDNQLTENVQSSNAPSRSVSLDTKSEDSKENNAKLLHTGELHDSLVLPLPRGVTESLKHKSDGTIAAEVKTKDEVADMLSNAGLLHSGEFHDSIVLPFSIAKMKNLKVSEVSSDAVPVVSANFENDTGPVGVQVLQAPAPGAVTSARAGSRVNCEAHAQQSDVFPPAAIDGKRLSASMGSGDGQATAQQDISMESEAARKIQAGFRGYQVRKQLKLKRKIFTLDETVFESPMLNQIEHIWGAFNSEVKSFLQEHRQRVIAGDPNRLLNQIEFRQRCLEECADH